MPPSALAPKPAAGRAWRGHRAAAALLAAVVAAAAVMGAADGDGHAPPTVAVAVAGGAGRVVPRHFLGFSMEYPSVPTYFGTPARPNRPFVALMRTLARAQRSVPEVRIGGDSADVTWWDPAGLPVPADVSSALGPAWLADLTTLEARLRLPLWLTVDLALERPDNAVAFARAAQAAVPRGALRALELGNEPDLYARPSPPIRGALAPRRLALVRPYPPARYRADALRYAVALADGLRAPPELVAGAFAGVRWNATLPALLRAARGRIGGVSVHAYPLHGCHPAERRRATVARLLAPAASRGLARRVARAIHLAGVPASTVRVDELNTVTCGGLRGTSDTVASALWSADTLFAMLRLGVSGVDIQSLVGAPYAPFRFTPAGAGGWRAQARPLMYGLLLFARAAPAGSRLVPVVQRPAGGILTWATRDARGTLRVLAIDPSPGTARTVLVAAPRGRPAPVARVTRLRAPGVDARDGVTLGGERLGPDGRLHGPRRTARLAPAAGSYRLALPAGSAALLTIPPPARR